MASLNIALHHPEIPQNTGNIGRTCVAIGAKLWLVHPLGFDISEKQVRRSGLDYWQHLDLAELADTPSLQQAIAGKRAYFFTKSAIRCYTRVDYQPGDWLVFGSETRGLPAELLEAHAATCVRIPTSPLVRSLNLANSVAIAAYEAIRQWGGLPADVATASTSTIDRSLIDR